MAEAETDDDDDDDDNKVPNKGKHNAKKVAFVTAAVADGKRRRGGEGRGKDAVQAIAPVLIRRFAKFAATVLIPQEWVAWLSTRTKGDRDTLDGIAVVFGFILDRLDLLSEATQKELSDLLADFSGALGDRMKELPALKAAAAATALAAKEKELRELITQPAFAANATNPSVVEVHWAQCHTIAMVVAKNAVLTGKKGGGGPGRTPIAPFTGEMVRAQGHNINHACCGTHGRDYFKRVDALEKEIEGMKPKDFDAFLASPDGLQFEKDLVRLGITPIEMSTGNVAIGGGVTVSFPKGIMGCLRESGFERADVALLIQPGITKEQLVLRLAIIRDRSKKAATATGVREAVRDGLAIARDTADALGDVAGKVNDRTGVADGLNRAAGTLHGWAARIRGGRTP
jgi:hypothetical protein